jgi:hypothetical protein
LATHLLIVPIVQNYRPGTKVGQEWPNGTVVDTALVYNAEPDRIYQPNLPIAIINIDLFEEPIYRPLTEGKSVEVRLELVDSEIDSEK